MPAYRVCQNFFRDALSPFHKYRQNALLDATLALINGASLTLTSIGRYLLALLRSKIKLNTLTVCRAINRSIVIFLFFSKVLSPC